jgi:hypothetical protein
MDPFADIPSYILLDTVKLLPDIECLGNLVEASPVIASLFDECANEIIEIFLSKQLHELFYLVVSLRSTPPPSYEEFSKSYVASSALNAPMKTGPKNSSLKTSLSFGRTWQLGSLMRFNASLNASQILPSQVL